MKPGFLIYNDYKDTLLTLTDSELGKLIRAIFKYEEDGVIPDLKKTLMIAFGFIKQDLDRNTQKYENICIRNKKNIKKRWSTKNTSGKIGIPEIPDDTKNTNLNLNLNLNKTKLKKGYTQLTSLKEKDFKEIATKYDCPIAFVRSKYDDMCLWVGEKTGRDKGRNWKLTLMNWVKRDSLKIKQDYAKQNNEVAL